MAPSNRRTGTHLTPDQIEEIRRRLRAHGHCSRQFRDLFPAVRCAQAFGRNAEGRELAVSDADAVPGLYDLTEVWLSAVGDESGAFTAIEGQITVAEAPVSGDTVPAVYTLGFNADGDAATGVVHAGLAGVDRIVRVTLLGPKSAGSFHATGEVEDVVSGTVQLLPQAPEAVIDEQFPDLDGTATDASLSLLLTIPSELLALAVVEVPVVASAGDGFGTWDTAELVYDQEAWLERPTLETFGDGTPIPGEPYSFAVSGLHPGSPFTLYLDEIPVLEGTLDDLGGISGEFIFPVDLPTDTAHFLTVQDATGEFAGTLTCPEWADVRLPEGSVAKGGAVELTVEGTKVRVPTQSGETASQVVSAVAAAINASPSLAARGVTAQAVGHRLTTKARVTGVDIRDPGLKPRRGAISDKGR